MILAKSYCSKFEEFEKAVMQKIMEKDTPVNAILREQYERSEVINRDFSGVGFFTEFRIPTDAPQIPKLVQSGYGNVTAIINGIHGYGFILFFKNGFINLLEGYTSQSEWPQQIFNFTLNS